MELRQIQYFIEVAKLEHVTEASYSLHVAQSAISRQILKLEAELGVSLFTHQGRKVKLTPIGKTFLKHMQQLMKVIDEANQEIREMLDPEKGTVRIGFPSSLAAHMVPDIVSSFRKRHPHVQFQLHHGSYRELVDWVENIPRSTVIVPVSEPRVTRNVGVITANNRELPSTEKLFYDFLKGYSPE